MTPKEKAQELVDKYSNYTSDWDYLTKAKQCALIAVDEILADRMPFEHTSVEYWQEVKQEMAKI